MIVTAHSGRRGRLLGVPRRGLAARYVLRRRRLGLVLLLGSPAADLALLALTAADLQRGAAPTQAHALAAMYLGFTVAFGHDVVRWVDQRFAHR